MKISPLNGKKGITVSLTKFILSVVLKAGSFAGLSEHILLLPLDNIKTHLQTISPNLKNAVNHIMKSNGVFGFFNGSLVVSIGCIPAHAFFFMSYEIFKDKFVTKNKIDIFGNMLVGSMSNLMHEVIMTPVDLVKQRIQINNNITYAKIITDIYKKEGIKSFFRSLPVNYLMNFPNSAVIVGVNENLKHLYKNNFGTPNMLFYFLSAGISGSIASMIMIPMDNIKTRLNTQRSFIMYHPSNPYKITNGKKIVDNIERSYIEKTKIIIDEMNTKDNIIKYKNAINTVKIIKAEEGIRGFYKGLSSKMVGQSISTAISWSVYEFFKNMMLNKSNKK